MAKFRTKLENRLDRLSLEALQPRTSTAHLEDIELERRVDRCIEMTNKLLAEANIYLQQQGKEPTTFTRPVEERHRQGSRRSGTSSAAAYAKRTCDQKRKVKELIVYYEAVGKELPSSSVETDTDLD
jgi:hypothetical protein